VADQQQRRFHRRDAEKATGAPRQAIGDQCKPRAGADRGAKADIGSGPRVAENGRDAAAEPTVGHEKRHDIDRFAGGDGGRVGEGWRAFHIADPHRREEVAPGQHPRPAPDRLACSRRVGGGVGGEDQGGPAKWRRCLCHCGSDRLESVSTRFISAYAARNFSRSCPIRR